VRFPRLPTVIPRCSWALFTGAAVGAAVFFGQTPVGAQDTGVVRGSVESRFQGATRPLPGARVRVTTDARTVEVQSDALGRYRIEGLPAGRMVLVASHPGHAGLELAVSVPPGGTVDVDLELLATPIVLSPLDVTSGRDEVMLPAPGDRTARVTNDLPELELQALDLGPGLAQAGLIEAVRGIPGNDPADAQDILFMRGATTDLKLVLLDGVPVYTPFHVAGLMRSFEPAVLGSANLHVGGAPARYDGGLTHILDLRTREARRDRLRASGSVDLLTSSVALESPVGSRAGILASARALHDLGSPAVGAGRPYGYRDALLSVAIDLFPGHRLGFTGFANEEEVLLDYRRAPDDARWSNRAGTVRYAAALGGARFEGSVGVSGYAATLPLRAATAPGPDSVPPALLATAGTERVRTVAEVAWGSPAAPLRLGVSHERMTAAFQAVSPSDERTNENRARAESTGVFFEATRPLAPGLSLRGGLRADYFPTVGVRTAPRAAFLWEVGPDALLTIAAGRYHQSARAVDPGVEYALASVAGSGLEPHEFLPVATADHVVLSLDQKMGAAVAFGLEGFFKSFQGLHQPRRATIRSSGVDLRVRSVGERASGWVGYGLSWFWSGTDLSGRTADFSGRHLLTAGLTGRLAGPLEAEARVSYGAGLPYTSIPIPRQVQEGVAEPTVSSPSSSFQPNSRVSDANPVVNGLDEDFLRVDLELHARFEPSWVGRIWNVRPYLRLLNALDRRDSMFYAFEPWREDGMAPLAERPLLPLLGISFSF